MENYSVLMSVYAKEHPEYLRQSIQSILAQTVPTDDFILVCDGPLTEELDCVVGEFSEKYSDFFHVVRLKENVGLGPALNAGMAHCRNELIARMDSDDYAPSNRCELQLDSFESDPELSIVAGAILEFEGNPQNVISCKRMPEEHDAIVRYAKQRCPFNHPTVMYRKSAVLAAGGYPNLPQHEDYGLWVRMLMNGVKTHNLSDVLCYMRVDSGMYGRRGGFKYYRTAVGFRWYLFKQRFCNLWELCYGVAGLTVICLTPTFIRKLFYRRLLRTKI